MSFALSEEPGRTSIFVQNKATRTLTTKIAKAALANKPADRLALLATVAENGKSVEQLIEDASASIRQAQALGTRWTTRTLKAGSFAGIGVGVDDARMHAFWDGLRLAGLAE